jgi:hypothetical protein
MVYYYYYNWMIPVLVIVAIFCIIFAIMMMIKHRRRQSIPVLEHQEINVVRIIDSENLPPSNPENVHQDLNKCMSCNSNLTYWRLNCGGTLCNKCIIRYSTGLASNEALHCPKCNNPVFNFSFMNRYVPSSDRDVSRIENVNPINLHGNLGNICNICGERVGDKRINCQSPDHFLCYVCYDRLINVQKILLCPFCRTLINNEINEEEAPVILG